MVRNQECTTDQCSWTEETMVRAVKAFEDNKVRLFTAAKTFNVPRTTLWWRVLSNVSMPEFGQHTTFSRTVDEELVTHLLKLDSLGYGLTFKELQTLVNRFAFANGLKHPFNNEEEMAGNEWVRGFPSLHKALSVSVSEALSFARVRELSKGKISQFYDNLSMKLHILGLWDKFSHIFNCDESGLQLIYKPQKVISQNGTRDVVSQTYCEEGETVSVMACVTAAGHYVPPFIVMKGQCQNDNYEIGMPPLHCCQTCRTSNFNS
ncbi:hypothetical protein PR048_014009 [Dryococelus australis]|uniref:HTH psq-type domain-containing protein n=1 Tax=Dryococelus australis TaxID=614101 RepID=A0ABQ9HTT4_9NEOP|nr:hypothetical protein PR048_014009 [Dryococelus australis]